MSQGIETRSNECWPRATMRYTDLVIVLALSSITISTTKANSEVDGRRVVRGVTPLQVEDEGQSGYLVDDAQRVNDSESTYLLEGEQTNGNYSLEERRINDEVERAEDFYAEDVEGKGTSPFEAGQGNGSYFFEGQINSNYSVEETKNEDDYYVEETHRYNDYPFEEGYKNDTQAVEGEDEGKPAKEIDNTQMDASESMYNLQFIRKKVEKLIEEVDKSVEFLAGTQTADHESLISWKNVAHKAQTLFDITRNLSSETFPAQQKTEINETVHSADESEILAASSKRHVKVAPTPVPSSAFSSPTSVLKINPLHVLEKLNCELEAISYGHDHEAGIAAHEVLCEIRKLWHLLLLSGKNLKSEMSVGPLMGHDDDGTLSLQDLTSSKVPSTLIQHGPAIMEALIKDPNHLSVLPDILKESVPLAHIVESLHRLEGAVGKFFLVLRDSFEPHLGKHEHVKVLNDLNDKLLMIVPNFLKRINEHLETKLSKEQSSVPAKSMDPEESATTNFLKETNGSPISLANYMELMKETVNILHSVYGAYHASGFSDFLISARKIFSEISTENIGKLVNVVPFNKCLLHSTCKDDSKAVNGGTLNDPQIVAASSFGEVSIGNPFSSISSNLDKLPIDALQSGLASSSSAVSSAMNTIQDIPQNIVKLKGRKGVILSDPQTVATSAYTQVVVEDEASSNTKIENQANLIDPSIDDLQTTGASFSSVVFPSLNSIADVPQNIAAELKNTLPFGIAETSSNSDSSSLVSVTTNGGAGNDPTLIKLPFDTFQSTLSSSSSAISETLNGVNDVPQKAVLGIVNLSPIEVVGSSSDCDPSASIPFPESIQINPSNSLTSAVEYQPTFVNIPADGSQSISSSMVSSTVNSIKDTPQKVVPGLANLWPEYASGSATSGSSSLSTTNFSPPFDVPFGFRSSSATSSVSSTIGDVSRNILAVVKDASPPKSWRPFFPPSEAGAVLSDQIVALDGATSSASELRPVVLKNGLRSPLAKIVESAQVNVTEVSQSIPNVSKKSSTSIKENAGPSVKEKIKVPHGRNHTRQKTRGKSSRVKERPCHSRKVPNACTETPSLIKATEDTIVPAIDKVLLPWTDLLSSKTQTTSSPTSNQSSVKNTFYDEILSSLVLYLNGENSQKNRKSSKTDGTGDVGNTRLSNQSGISTTDLRFPQKTSNVFRKKISRIAPLLSRSKTLDASSKGVAIGDPSSENPQNQEQMAASTSILDKLSPPSISDNFGKQTEQRTTLVPSRFQSPLRSDSSMNSASLDGQYNGNKVYPAGNLKGLGLSLSGPVISTSSSISSSSKAAPDSPNKSAFSPVSGSLTSESSSTLSSAKTSPGFRPRTATSTLSSSFIPYPLPVEFSSTFSSSVSMSSDPLTSASANSALALPTFLPSPILLSRLTPSNSLLSRPLIPEPALLIPSLTSFFSSPRLYPSLAYSSSPAVSPKLLPPFWTSMLLRNLPWPLLQNRMNSSVPSVAPSSFPYSTSPQSPSTATSSKSSLTNISPPSSSPDSAMSLSSSLVPCSLFSSTLPLAPSSSPISALPQSPSVVPSSKPSLTYISPPLESSSLPSSVQPPSPSLIPFSSPDSTVSLIPSSVPTSSSLSTLGIAPSSSPSSALPQSPSAIPSSDPSLSYISPPLEYSSLPSSVQPPSPSLVPFSSPDSTISLTPSAVPTSSSLSTLSIAPSSSSFSAVPQSPSVVPSSDSSLSYISRPLEYSSLPSSAQPPSPSLVPFSSPDSTVSLITSSVPTSSSLSTLALSPSSSPSSSLPQAPSAVPSSDPSLTYISPPLGPSALPSLVESRSPLSIPLSTPGSTKYLTPSSVPTSSSLSTLALAPSSSPSSSLPQSPSAVPSSDPSSTYISPPLGSLPSLAPSSSPDTVLSMKPSLMPSSLSSSTLPLAPSSSPSSALPRLPPVVPSSEPSLTYISPPSESSSPSLKTSSPLSPAFSLSSFISSLLPSSALSSAPSSAPSSSSSATLPHAPSSSFPSLSVSLPIANGTLINRSLKISLELPRDKIQSALGMSSMQPGDVISLTLGNGTAMFGPVTDTVSPISFSYSRPNEPNGRLWRLRSKDFRDPEYQNRLESLMKNNIRPS